MAAREIVKNEMLKSLILLDTKRTFFGLPHRPHRPVFDDGAIRSHFMMAVRRMRGVSLSHRRTSNSGEIGSYSFTISTHIDRTILRDILLSEK